MGGNAIKDAVRLNKAEYFELCEEVIAKILKYTLEHPINSKNSIRFNVIKAYNEKPTYGDMDIIIDDYKEFDYDGLVSSFNPSQIHKNSSVISFDYKNFQIDLIRTKPNIFDFSNNYFSYNDLGNLMGRIAKSVSLVYGHDGLFYKIRKQNYKTEKVLIDTDSRSVFELLDYDYDRFLQGFDTLTDIFEFVKSSKYYTSSIFAFENRDHVSRVRDKKRKTYTAFLDYIGERTDFDNVKHHIGAYEDIDFHNDPTVKEQMLSTLIKRYKNLKPAIDAFESKYLRIKQFKSKFNATMVTDETGLVKEELGKFIKHFNYNVRNDEFYEFVISKSEDEIRQRIIADYNSYKYIINN